MIFMQTRQLRVQGGVWVWRIGKEWDEGNKGVG
jgi:hypothetical protein